MKNVVIENIEKLFRSHIITFVLFLVLIIIYVLVTIGVLKFKILNSKRKNILLVSFVVIASSVLLILKIVDICPVYKDYKESAYIVIENAKVIVKDGSTGGIDSTNRVVIYDGEEQIRLKMQTDYSLDAEVEYTGDVAYLKNSNYLVWYDFGEN